MKGSSCVYTLSVSNRGRQSVAEKTVGSGSFRVSMYKECREGIEPMVSIEKDLSCSDSTCRLEHVTRKSFELPNNCDGIG